MEDLSMCVEVEVEFDKANIELVDAEAARLGCTRDDLIGKAVEFFIKRHRHVLREKKVEGEVQTSGKGHTADKPPTPD